MASKIYSSRNNSMSYREWQHWHHLSSFCAAQLHRDDFSAVEFWITCWRLRCPKVNGVYTSDFRNRILHSLRFKHSFQKWLLRENMTAHLVPAEVLVICLCQLKVAECKHGFGVPSYELCVSWTCREMLILFLMASKQLCACLQQLPKM